jgi:polar amino acid transport system permease protein
MLRGFGAGDLWYLVEAARWTVALTALAMAGGGLLGLHGCYFR